MDREEKDNEGECVREERGEEEEEEEKEECEDREERGGEETL